MCVDEEAAQVVSAEVVCLQEYFLLMKIKEGKPRQAVA